MPAQSSGLAVAWAGKRLSLGVGRCAALFRASAGVRLSDDTTGTHARAAMHYCGRTTLNAVETVDVVALASAAPVCRPSPQRRQASRSSSVPNPGFDRIRT